MIDRQMQQHDVAGEKFAAAAFPRLQPFLSVALNVDDHDSRSPRR